jgi:hypothetical protein
MEVTDPALSRRHQSESQQCSMHQTTSATSNMLSGFLLEDAILFNAVRKGENPPNKVLFLGALAGVWVGLAGLAAASAAGGVPEDVRERWVVLPRLLVGGWFAFGMLGGHRPQIAGLISDSKNACI